MMLASIETTLELWASALCEVKVRMVLEATDEAEVSDIMLGPRRGKVRSFSIEETR